MFVEEPFQKEQLLPINLAVDRNAFKAKAQLTNHLSSNEKTIWTCLSEGAASGAFGVFLYLSSSLYVSRNFYNFLFIKWLTYFMACGATIGLAAGGTIRLYARLRRNEPGLVVRLLNGILITGLAAVVFTVLGDGGRLNWHNFGPISLFCVLVGFPIGLLTGSRVRPTRILAFGMGKPRTKQGVVEVIGGVGVRLGSVLGLIHLGFIWVCFLSLELPRDQRLVLLCVLLYFAIGSLVSLAPLTRWIRSTASSVLNSPLVFILMKPPSDLGFLRYVILIYLILWLVFILGSHLPEKANAFITREFRYYLID